MLSEKAKKLGQEPASPYAIEHGTEAWSGGFTKREAFAKAAMEGLCANPEFGPNIKPDDYASDALLYADALLEALAKEEG